MDALMLARIQFGFSVGFHYLFPITTLGLTLFIFLFETLHRLGFGRVYREAVDFLARILGIIFTVGVATGLLLPFAFGANWSRFSLMAGGIFGSALAIEAFTAFALESVFLAVLLHGRDRVSPAMYWLSAFLVFFGAHLSGFWIVAANSWMQTPAGVAVSDGRLVLTNAFQALLNPSAIIRFIHVVAGAWLTGAVCMAGLASFYAYRNLHESFTRAVLPLGLAALLLFAAAQPVLGHFHILQVLRDNPEKEAAYEGLFKTTKGATLYAFGIPDAENRTIRFGVGVPYLLSLLESGDPQSEVKGLEEFPEADWPPVNIIFTTFHLMVILGMVMLGAGFLGVFLLWKKRLFETRRFLRFLPFLVPVPYLTNELGWAGAEIGRQPWIIYRILRTAEAHSTILPAWKIGLTLSVMAAVYGLILFMTLFFLRRMILKGPDSQIPSQG